MKHKCKCDVSYYATATTTTEEEASETTMKREREENRMRSSAVRTPLPSSSTKVSSATGLRRIHTTKGRQGGAWWQCRRCRTLSPVTNDPSGGDSQVFVKTKLQHLSQSRDLAISTLSHKTKAQHKWRPTPRLSKTTSCGPFDTILSQAFENTT